MIRVAPHGDNWIATIDGRETRFTATTASAACHLAEEALARGDSPPEGVEVFVVLKGDMPFGCYPSLFDAHAQANFLDMETAHKVTGIARVFAVPDPELWKPGSAS